MEVKAKVVVLAAGSLESTRLLLNSGIANSSGAMGHYLTTSSTAFRWWPRCPPPATAKRRRD